MSKTTIAKRLICTSPDAKACDALFNERFNTVATGLGQTWGWCDNEKVKEIRCNIWL